MRYSLYQACEEWMRAVKKQNRKFLGGDKPNLADLVSMLPERDMHSQISVITKSVSSSEQWFIKKLLYRLLFWIMDVKKMVGRSTRSFSGIVSLATHWM